MKAGTGPRHDQLLLTSLLETPRLCGWMLAAGALHLALAATPLGGWRCPFHEATGWPCPGCGLGRASVLLLRGEVRESFHLHAFAGLLLLVLGVIGGGLIPGSAGERVRRVVREAEERMWLVPAALAGLILYWILRFWLDAPGFRQLVL